jgi:hypothetical protein
MTETNKLPALDINAYHGLLKQLATEGTCHGKTANIAAVQFQPLKLETLTQAGNSEVVKTANVDPLYIAMDLDQYPTRTEQKALINSLFDHYEDRLFNPEIEEPDLSTSGFWMVKGSAFNEDYKPAGNGVYQPDPEAFRICLNTDKDIGLPTTWDTSFAVETGGTIAIRAKDMPKLIETLTKIDNGETTPQAALLKPDGTSIFDAYGMEPAFLDNNYEPTTAPQTVRQTMEDYSDHTENNTPARPADPYKNHKNLEFRAAELGIGSHSYAIDMHSNTIKTGTAGVPGQENETILATSGSTFAPIRLNNNNNLYAAQDFAVLSQDTTDNQYKLREYSLWRQPTYLSHESHMLHVISETNHSSLEDAQAQLAHIDANHKALRSPALDTYVRPHVEAHVNRGTLTEKAANTHASTWDNISSFFNTAKEVTKDDLIAQEMAQKASYTHTDINLAGLTLKATPQSITPDHAPKAA